MATDTRGHTILGSGETPSTAGLNAMLASVNDPVLAANATARGVALATAGSSAARPLLVLQTDTKVLWLHDGTSWSQITEATVTEVVATITYGASWREPTTAAFNPAPAPLLVYKRNGRVYAAGSIENAATLSSGGFGQFAAAFTIPAGFRPANTIIVPATVNVVGQFLAAGQAIIANTGVAILQTTTAWPSTAAGNGRFDLASMTWLAAS